MRAYEVKTGIVGDVYFPKPSKERRKNWKVRQDLMFAHEEMIFDPVSLANGALKEVSRWCRSMAAKGYAGFRREGYLLVVKYADVNVI